MPTKNLVASVVSVAAIAMGLLTAPLASSTEVSVTEPTRVVWHPSNSSIAYVATDFDNFSLGKTITKVDFSTEPPTSTDLVTMVDPANCHANVNTLAITPDATTLYAGGYSCVMKIDLTASPVSYTSGFIGQGWVQEIAVSSNAAYAINPEGGAVYKTTKDSVTGWSSTWTQLVRPNNIGYPVSRSGSVTPDGTTLFVASEAADLRQINTSTGVETTVTGTTNGMYGTYAVAVDPRNGAYALVLDGQNTLKKLDISSNPATITQTVSFPDDRRLRDISIDADGVFAYVVGDATHTLLKINTSDLSLTSRMSFGAGMGDVAASPIRANNNVITTIPSQNKVVRLPAAPTAPTSVTATAGDESAVVTFTAPQDGFSSITNFEYRVDGAGAWTALSPADTTSPVTIPGLTNGTPAAIELRAINALGNGTASTSVTVTPQGTPRAPRSVSVSPGSRQLTIAFTAPASDGGQPITNYEYSLNGGSTWVAVNPATTTSPVTVTGLTNGMSYQVSIRAVNSLGGGAASTPVSTTPGDPSSGGSAPEASTPEPTPSPSATNTEDSSSAPTVVAVPEPVAVGEGIVIVDGRVSKVTIQAVAGRTWQVKGEDFTLEFTPKAELGELEGTFSAKAGTAVEVRGDGFVPGSLIATYLPGALAASLGEARVGADGSFEVTSSFPASLQADQYVFQVNGLASATSVRSVNLGVQVLAADKSGRAASAKRVIFKSGKTVLTPKAKVTINRFVRTYREEASQAILVPTVHATDAGQKARSLARDRARAVKQAMRASGFTAPIRISSKVRVAKDPSARLRTTMWVRFSV